MSAGGKRRRNNSIILIYKAKVIWLYKVLTVRIAAKEVVHYRVKNECMNNHQVAAKPGAAA